MTNLRKKLEHGFEVFTGLIYDNRIKTLFLMLAVVAAFSSQIPKIKLDMSIEGWLHDDDPVKVAYDNFKIQFGREDVLIIGITPPNVFDLTFLKKLKTLHEELEEEVPYIEKITSLINARDTKGIEDELIVEDLLEKWPENDAQMAALKDRVMSNPMYQNIFISEDGHITQILIQFDTRIKSDETDILDGFESEETETEGHKPGVPTLSNEESKEITLIAEKVLDRYRGEDFIVHVTGGPALLHYIIEGFADDLTKFMIMAFIVIAVFLLIMFRRISGVIYPFIVVISSLASTIGIMAIAGIPFSSATQILPSFLVAVGIGGSVHILAIFYFHYQQNNNKKEAIVYALGHSGVPVVMTNVTTSCGLLSFSMAELQPISELGWTSAIGVMLSLLFTVVLLPALIAVFPVKNKPLADNRNTKTAMGRVLNAIGEFSTGHPIKILLVCAVLTLFSLFMATKIIFSHDPLRWFPKDSYIRYTTETLDREMKGTINLEVVIDTGKVNGFYDPDLLKRVEEAKKHIESMTYKDVIVGKVLTLPMVLMEINQALNRNNPEHYSIPQSRDLVAQEFLLFENSGSDDLEDFTDMNFTKARMSILVPFLDSVQYNTFAIRLEKYLAKQFPNEKTIVTGQSIMMAKTNTAAIMSMRTSYLCALFVISFLMVILIGDFHTGMLSMIPNVFPIVLMVGVMGLFGKTMNVFSMLVGSIAIGLAVDDTIHFMHNFKKYFDETNDQKEAVHLTLQSTGRAMLVTTIVLSMGFFIYMFGTMNNTFDFGLLTGFAVSMALIADFFLAPALMMVFIRKKTL